MFSFLAATVMALVSPASAAIVARQTASTTSVTALSEITECAITSSSQVCKAGTTVYIIAETPAGVLPSSYTGCHMHATDTYCLHDGVEVVVTAAITPAATDAIPTAAAETGAPTAVPHCHLDGVTVFCMLGPSKYRVVTTPTETAASAIPTAFTGCHSHGSDTYCITPSGDEVEIVAESTDSSDEATGESSQEEHCHFHAGVEHCVGGHESEGCGTSSCHKITRDYNIPLRIGMLFVILVTSAIGVYFPICLVSWMPTKPHTMFIILKQFGTGVIISTAFVHLYTHADLTFGNECLGELEYEATTAAIVMAGLFLSFLVEYLGKRFAMARAAANPASESRVSLAAVTVLVLECGIIFHSMLIGITLVVAGDSSFITLSIVILFHQMFEGVALGTRIAQLGHPSNKSISERPDEAERTALTANILGPPKAPYFSFARKLLLATPFALVTPVGMAIGIGVLSNFNGNDRHTIIAIGSLDALSAGILIWVGIVEMWAEDWLHEHGELFRTSPIVTFLAGFGLIAGLVTMSVLGKWV